MRLRHKADYRNKVRIALGPAPDHGVTVFRILICNSLYDTAQMIHNCINLYPDYLFRSGGSHTFPVCVTIQHS